MLFVMRKEYICKYINIEIKKGDWKYKMREILKIINKKLNMKRLGSMYREEGGDKLFLFYVCTLIEIYIYLPSLYTFWRCLKINKKLIVLMSERERIGGGYIGE